MLAKPNRGLQKRPHQILRMFWRFGFHNASAIDAILDKEGVKLDDIMGEDELIQEVKGQNIKLIEFLSRTENIKSLLGYITSTTLEESKAFKYYPFHPDIRLLLLKSSVVRFTLSVKP